MKMKKRVSLFLALAMALSLLAGCGSNADSPTVSDASTPPVASTDTDKLDGAKNGKVPDDELPYIPMSSEPDTPPELPAPPMLPELPQEIHDMDTASLVADYQSGIWSGGRPLWSEDGSTFVNVYADGFLSYNCQGIIVYDSEALGLAEQMVAEENPLPDDRRGEKVYIDLPSQRLPEGALTSKYVVGEGTFVQMADKVELYRREELIDTWEIQANERFLLATRLNIRYGENYVLADDQLLQLVEGGTTKLVHDHVVDVNYSDLMFLVVLTLEDGVLTRHSNVITNDWHGDVIAEGVADARMALGGAIYLTDDGEAFISTTLMSCYYHPGSNIHSLGHRTLDEVEELWKEFSLSSESLVCYDEQLKSFLGSYDATGLNENILA